jgi:hypothetical protein
MSKRNAVRSLAVAAAAVVLSAGVLAFAGSQKPGAANRYGKWKMDSENPPPFSNIMTYEPFGDGGMKVTVSTVSAKGTKGEWGYDTLFDGVFRPVRGQEGRETAVEFINDRSTRIQNKSKGVVTQIIINTLSEDLKTINNEYVNFDAEGKIRSVTHAVYRKMQ